MASRAELKAKVSLNSSPFRKGLNKLKGVTRRFARNFGRPLADATKRLARMGVVAGTIVVAGFIAGAKSIANFLDEIDKMNKRTGLSIEFLSQMAIAAALGGAKIGDVEKAMKRMSTSVVDANKGLKTAKDAFNDLKINFEEFKKLKPDAQFQLILKQLSKVENKTKRAGLAQKIFGRAGTALLPVIENLEKAEKLAERFGLNITPEQVQQGADFVDNVELVKFALKGLFLQVFGFKDLNKGLKNFIDKIVELKNSGAFQTFVAKLKNGVGIAVDTMIRLTKVISFLTSDSGKNFRTLIRNAGLVVLFLASGFAGPIIKLMMMVASAIAAPLLSIALPALLAFAAAVAGMNVGAALEKSFDLSGFITKVKLLGEALVSLFTSREGEDFATRVGRTLGQLESGFDHVNNMKNDVGFGEQLAKEFDSNFGAVGDKMVEGIAKAKKKLQETFPVLSGLKEATDAWKDSASNIKEGTDGTFEKAKNDTDQINDTMDKIEKRSARFRGGFASLGDPAGAVGRRAGFKTHAQLKQVEQDARNTRQLRQFASDLRKNNKEVMAARKATAEAKASAEEKATLRAVNKVADNTDKLNKNLNNNVLVVSEI